MAQPWQKSRKPFKYVGTQQLYITAQERLAQDDYNIKSSPGHVAGKEGRVLAS